MQNLLSFIEQWIGGLSGVLISLSGILLCVLAVGAFWDKRGQLRELFIFFCCGLILTFNKTSIECVTTIFDIREATAYWLLLPSIGAIGGSIFLRWLVRRSRQDSTGKTHKSSIFTDETYGRSVRGTTIGAPLVIFICVMGVFITGLATPQVMIGDEVTHYYMLVKQAEDLSKPNFFAEIPIATGEVEVRRYPHSFLWHYIGAVIFYLTGGSFVAIQLYQTFFLVQFLTVAYLLARDRYGVESRSALAYVLVLASLPLTLIFSVTFYQDVPMTAQILTAFYLLRKGRWFWASLFLSLAIGFKVTAALFYPPFFLLLFFWQLKERGRVRSIAVTICALFIVLGVTWKIGRAIVTYGESVFYPQYQLERVIKKTKEFFESKAPVVSKKSGISEVNTDLSARPQQKTQIKESKPPIIANHPGDLRIKINYLVYGGLVLWITVAAGVLSKLISFIGLQSNYYKKSSFWLYLVGGTYTIMAAWYIRTAPDARFFLPGVPFLILPLLEKAVRLPKTKIFISGLAVLACLQGGYVLQKAYKLRALTSGMKEGIAFLEKHPPSGHIFMYPEGNYRFFPAQHEWYLGYRLRDFWRADNTARINLLNKYDISTVVVKKHLIAVVDEKITNLGVYPSRFVNDIKSDHRFSNVFENQELMIFELTGIGLK